MSADGSVMGTEQFERDKVMMGQEICVPVVGRQALWRGCW